MVGGRVANRAYLIGAGLTLVAAVGWVLFARATGERAVIRVTADLHRLPPCKTFIDATRVDQVTSPPLLLAGDPDAYMMIDLVVRVGVFKRWRLTMPASAELAECVRGWECKRRWLRRGLAALMLVLAACAVVGMVRWTHGQSSDGLAVVSIVALAFGGLAARHVEDARPACYLVYSMLRGQVTLGGLDPVAARQWAVQNPGLIYIEAS